MFGFGGRGKTTAPSLEASAMTIEQILAQIQLDPQQARMPTQDGYGWTFRRGSALIEIYLSEQENTGYLQVLSPMMHLPSSGLLPIYRHLLELNLQLTNVSVGVYLDVVYLFSERPLEGLDAVEVDSIIDTVATYADELDDRVVGEFGGRLFGKI